jgi:RNA polymerase sigma-70 factor (ECF subfamily)
MTWLREVDQWFLAHVLPHEPSYLALAQRLTRDMDTAHDLVQEGYVKMLAADNWRSIANPRAYVRRIIHNLGIEQIRRARIVTLQQIANLNTLDHLDQAPDSFSVAAGRDELKHVTAALDRLPPACRQALIMRKFEDLSPREIATRLGLSLSTVEKRIARGLVLLMLTRMTGEVHTLDITEAPWVAVSGA